VNSDDDSDMEDEQAPLEYNSEDYDTDERATHVAVGALMTRPSRKRKMLDAAYNRYAFNDDSLPDWFAEDESRHNRPQIPVTKEMVDAIKARYKDLAAKPTHKVAEARARKKRRLVQKIDTIKRKASAIADQVCIHIYSLYLCFVLSGNNSAFKLG
jgi:AdoMet-dependent rRNA methyltransferase SPB1